MVVQTIGSTGKSAAVFFELLREGGVRRVIDVRNSDDRQCAGFTKGDDLEFFLRTILDIDYHWSPDLAPTDEIRGMDDWQDHEKSFLALMSGREVENRVDPNLVNGACLLCSEPEPDRCHRRLVAEYLRERWSGRGIDLEITHLS
ncbi:MAG: DUF488 domain-containing protein [Verrucomicrobia bacterium]|nr:DUF488 domain-containing protein [Verrucomicrobiota bacterium]